MDRLKESTNGMISAVPREELFLLGFKADVAYEDNGWIQMQLLNIRMVQSAGKRGRTAFEVNARVRKDALYTVYSDEFAFGVILIGDTELKAPIRLFDPV